MSERPASTYSYDQVPYPSNPFRQTHPDRLATIAHLFGLKPQPIDRCRVLEIGCASGGNIIPMAEQLPGSEFLGIDLSQVQTEQACQFAARAGLTNVEIRRLSIMDVDAALGRFDYIICHGVYSWVTDAVQDKILDICSTSLQPHGVAYVSYNAYPGWHMRGMIRDMMCFHTSRFSDAPTRIRQARNLLDFMVKYAPQNAPFGMHLKSESELLRNHSDGYLFHEHLEESNRPTYFFQFAQQAAGKGLQYLSEADMANMYFGHLPAEARETLERVAADLIQMEQYVDFLRNRIFRQTLLCHGGQPVDRELRPAALEALWIASPLIPVEQNVAVRSAAPLKFSHPGTKQSLTTTTPFMKAALMCLAENWPTGLAFGELMAQATARTYAGEVHSAERWARDADHLGRSLFECYLSEMIEFHAAAPRFTTKLPERPSASKVARVQAEAGNKAITNLRHESGLLDDVDLHVLRLLDGARDRPALLDALHGLVEQKVLVVQENGRPLSGRSAVQPQLERTLEQSLLRLASNAMVLADGA